MKLRSVRIASIVFLTTLILSLYTAAPSPAQYIDKENSFFSYQRFYEQLDILTNASDNKNIRYDIKAFMQNYVSGIHAISAGDPETAKKKLLKALSIWPEYFGTDFLLARVNEDTGNYKLAAMFYKSYLNKLKSYSEGWYRVTGPLMKGITPYRIENYDDAYALVRERLKTHGIDLAAVQPFYIVPDFLKLPIIFIMFGLVYVIMVYLLIPHMKRMQHINNPPEGFWVCKKCATYNANIRLECDKCRTKR